MARAKKKKAEHIDNGLPIGILVDSQIEEAIAQKGIRIDPFDEKYLEPATYDLRIGNNAALSTASAPLELSKTPFLVIEPGAMALVESLEIITLGKTFVARLGPKTDLLRGGVHVSTGPQIDPGFTGRIIVNMINLSPRPYTLKYMSPFLTLEFHRLSRTPKRLYSGPHQGKLGLSEQELNTLLAYHGPTLADLHKSFGILQNNLQDLSSLHPRLNRMLELLEVQPRGAPRERLVLRMQIETFAPEPYRVLKSIPVVIQEQEDLFEAGFFEANIHAAGDNEQEAYDNLRTLILDIYESLMNERGALTQSVTRQLEVLREFIGVSE